jgi:hypothetical protein
MEVNQFFPYHLDIGSCHSKAGYVPQSMLRLRSPLVLREARHAHSLQ